MQTDGPPFMGGEMLGRREYQDKGGSLTNLKTGATAAMLGLSDEGTRMYERHGLVYPARDEVSGYRSFDIMDVVMLQSARAYRQAGDDHASGQQRQHQLGQSQAERRNGAAHYPHRQAQQGTAPGGAAPCQPAADGRQQQPQHIQPQC